MKKTKHSKHTHKRLPLISIVMPVYNAGKYLRPAVESILNQSHPTLELVIVDDVSTDNSWQTLLELKKKDRRIRLFQNERHKGVFSTVKLAVSKARGAYIARMDADDVAYADRLEKQLSHLLSHQATVAVGGQCRLIDARGKIVGEKTFPTTHQKIYEYMFSFIPVQPSTLMIACKRLPINFSMYRSGKNFEDLELLFRLFQYGNVENLEGVVLKYRLHQNNTSLANIRATFFHTLKSRLRAVLRYNYTPSLHGLLITLGQAITVFLLPQSVSLLLYARIRFINYHTKKLFSQNLHYRLRLSG